MCFFLFYKKNLARIHSPNKGKSQSIRPISKRTPSWLTYSTDEIVTLIVNMAKDELTPSEIGVRLRDEYNISLVKPILGKSISEVLEEHDLGLSIPEDLNRLIKQAKRLQDHLKTHKGDRKNVRSLELIEAKIHRLAKYYKGKERLPPKWKYSTVIAQLM
ncbi:MAG: 30S ribosomal protein S15 [Candidatus Methylarchaceae archaeon HK02M1]|nr:30S ribosomal protein S15 [Candidatus Methylarchaceae archaeon HK02M1]